jgi:hypothetical protein
MGIDEHDYNNVIPFRRPVGSGGSHSGTNTLSPARETELVKTVVISDNVFSVPAEAFAWPSAGAVDPKYAKALEEQKRKRN